MEKDGSQKKTLIITLIIILSVGVGVTGYYFYGRNKKDDAHNDIYTIAYSGTPMETEEAKPNIPINFEELQKKNPDIYAWIRIDDTQIDYPVLQSVNDPEDYYLDHTVDRKSGLPGSIYTRMNASKDFSDLNTVVYGHNMKNGTMFKGLHKYESREYMSAHPYITVYTPTKVYKYKVFAAVTYSDALLENTFDFETPKGVTDFVKSLKDNKYPLDVVNDKVEVTEKDKLITLSTCIANKPQNRLLVVGVLEQDK